MTIFKGYFDSLGLDNRPSPKIGADSTGSLAFTSIRRGAHITDGRADMLLHPRRQYGSAGKNEVVVRYSLYMMALSHASSTILHNILHRNEARKNIRTWMHLVHRHHGVGRRCDDLWTPEPNICYAVIYVITTEYSHLLYGYQKKT